MSNRRPGQHLTPEQRPYAQDQFLQAFSMTANVRAASMKAGIDRSTFYAWIDSDPEFAERYKEAEEEANDVLRAEVWRRAVQGIERPIVSMGKIVMDGEKRLTTRDYSDNLLSLLLRARMPEFRDKQQVEHSGSIDVSGAKELLLQKLQQLREHSGEEKAG